MAFCHKCGTKAIEGAQFCQKCGARLIENVPDAQAPIEVGPSSIHGEEGTSDKDLIKQFMTDMPAVSSDAPREDEAVTEPVMSADSEEIDGLTQPIGIDESARSETAYGSMPHIEEQLTEAKDEQEQTVLDKDIGQEIANNADVYKALVNNISACPAIKSAKQKHKGAHFRGKFFRYIVSISTKSSADAQMRTVLRFPLSILYVLLAGLLCTTIVVAFQELLEYGSICIEWYHGLLFAFCALVAGAVVLIHTLVGSKEKDAIIAYTRETMWQKHIRLWNGDRTGIRVIKVLVGVIFVVAGTIVLPFSLPASLDYPDELLFNGLPATRFLEMTQNDIEAEFGEVEFIGQNSITGDNYYSDLSNGFCKVVYSKDTGKIIYIQLFSNDCSYNRKNLYKSMSRVLDILGKDHSYMGMQTSCPVYGSVHSGFYYRDGVYFGENPTFESVQWELTTSQSSYCKFYSAIPYEKGKVISLT